MTMIHPYKIFFGALAITIGVAYWADGFMAAVDRQGGSSGSERRDEPREDPPAAPSAEVFDEIHIPRGPDGHYWVKGDIKGVKVSFVVDTGASHLALTYEDAEQIGLYPAHLEYSISVSTANGPTRMAHVTLPSVSLGDVEVTDVSATVAQQGQLPVSLLGMSFLNQLNSFEFQGEELVLRR
ncbi:retropepsin-like aspartic protease family protein [Luteithermobacter gelatinilyticus]|uniref:retropepsin-like aspartic protease family protein n=1 Tax=Luteithermobacter gelatinilyticus TaxID=2582913 RepID=UPI001105F30F|nr:TIGR02281 family clan AA aspartic protease [Luteithermobacter gelatinilyticus]